MQAPQRTERRLEASGRIRPSEVLEAYKQTGLTPTYEAYKDGSEACAIGVLMVRDGAWQAEWEEVGPPFLAKAISFEDGLGAWLERRMEFVGRYYGNGFVSGFDGEDCPTPGDDDHPLARGEEHWERLGWRDGVRARRFVQARLAGAAREEG